VFIGLSLSKTVGRKMKEASKSAYLTDLRVAAISAVAPARLADALI